MDEEQFRERLMKMAEGLPPPGESRTVLGRARRRIARNSALAGVLAGVVAVSAISLSANLFDREARPVGKPVEVSAMSGALRCTARFPSRVVEPGTPTGVKFSLKNIGSESVRLEAGARAGLEIRTADGGSVWPNNDFWGAGRRRPVPDRVPIELKAGETASVSTEDPQVNWGGPLTVTPSCWLLGPLALPEVRLDVIASGGPLSEDQALSRALEETGGLFDDCRPAANGSPTTGLIQPPKATSPPGTVGPPQSELRAMSARCSARMQEDAGFWIVDLLIVTPSNAPDVEKAPLGRLGALPEDVSMLITNFEFIVTRKRAVNTHDGLTEYRTTNIPGDPDVLIPRFSFVDGAWQRVGAMHCGAHGGGGSGDVEISFINVCASKNAYSNQDYAYSVAYPENFLREALPGRRDSYKGELHLVRFFDKRFKGRYPDGQVLITLYLKDHAALDDWLNAHSGSVDGPQDTNVYFRGLKNLERTTGPQGRTAFAFDWVSSEGGEGRTTFHSVAFHTRDKVAVMSWYVHDQAYTATLEPIFREMLASWRPEK